MGSRETGLPSVLSVAWLKAWVQVVQVQVQVLAWLWAVGYGLWGEEVWIGGRAAATALLPRVCVATASGSTV